MSLHKDRTFIAWLIGVLEAGGLTVGDAVAPMSVPVGAGYVVVYSIGGGQTSGSLDAPRSDAAVMAQLTSSSAWPEQARWLADKARELIDAAVPAVIGDGRKVLWLDFPLGSYTLSRDDDVQPPRYWIPDRVEFGTA